MRKAVVTLLVFAIAAFSACISDAGIIDGNPERYFKQSITKDGNTLYLDKNSVRRYKDNITEYVGVVELDRSSDLFKKACELVPSTQEPLYVATAMRLDCINARFQGGKMMILGFEKADASAQIKSLWSQDSEEYGDWIPLKGGGIEPGAKALLCAPSF